jgi:hypothetical protein
LRSSFLFNWDSVVCAIFFICSRTADRVPASCIGDQISKKQTTHLTVNSIQLI